MKKILYILLFAVSLSAYSQNYVGSDGQIHIGRSTHPPSPTEGQKYYNNVDKALYLYDGTSWVDLTAAGGGGGTDNQTISVLDDIVSLEDGGSVDLSKYNSSTNKDFKVTPHFTLKAISEIQRNLSTEPKGIFVFGDSMKDIPIGYLLGSFQEYGLINGGLGSMPYFNSTYDGSIGFGSSVVLDSGATTVGINAQEGVYGQTEWLSDIYTVDSSGENIQFIYGGVQPSNAVTKIYVLTEVGGGTYTIQSNTNSAGWVNVSTGNSADAPTGMLVHTFDNLSNDDNIGYRILWESGIVKTIYPAIYKTSDKFIHVTAGTGGADFMKQTSVDSGRVRFLLQDLNVTLFTSSHRFEVADTTELQTGLDLMDAWTSGLALDVYYKQQWADTSLIDADIIAENNVIRKKCIEQGYLTTDGHGQLGGAEGTTLGGYDSVDSVHLNNFAKDTDGSEFLKFFNLNTYRGLVKSSPIINHSEVQIMKNVADPQTISRIGTDTFGFDFINLAYRYGKLGKGQDLNSPDAVALSWDGRYLSTGKSIIFSYDGSNNSKVPEINYPTIEAFDGGLATNYLKIINNYATGTFGVLRLDTDTSHPKSAVNMETLNTAIAGVSGSSPSSSIAQWDTLLATNVNSTSWSSINMNDMEILDAAYTDTGSSIKTIEETGRYNIRVKLSLEDTGSPTAVNFRWSGEIAIWVNDTEYVGNEYGAYIRSSNTFYSNISLDHTDNFTADDTIRVVVKRTSDNVLGTAQTVPGKCMLIIEKK